MFASFKNFSLLHIIRFVIYISVEHLINLNVKNLYQSYLKVNIKINLTCFFVRRIYFF